jgi:hypothetical protein
MANLFNDALGDVSFCHDMEVDLHDTGLPLISCGIESALGSSV